MVRELATLSALLKVKLSVHTTVHQRGHLSVSRLVLPLAKLWAQLTAY